MNEMTKSMKGVWLTGHGALDKLDVRNDIPVPKLTANDVLIRVGAAAVNNTDINTRTAWYSKVDATAKDASWAGPPWNNHGYCGFKRSQTNVIGITPDTDAADSQKYQYPKQPTQNASHRVLGYFCQYEARIGAAESERIG